MENYLDGKTVIITGAAGGFGFLTAQRVAKLGAKVAAADIKKDDLDNAVAKIKDDGGDAIGVVTDVSNREQMKALANEAVKKYGKIDIMINNAGIMPLAFFADHEQAADAWDRCIDINFKGVLHGIIAVHDQMIKQGQGHVVTVSSIYGNFPSTGGTVYAATKAAVTFLSEELRQESQGKIKVTVVKPTGVPATGLAGTVVNLDAAATSGILGGNVEKYGAKLGEYFTGRAPAEYLDPNRIEYLILDPELLADQIVYVINQPWGVSISEITVRASGDMYVL